MMMILTIAMFDDDDDDCANDDDGNLAQVVLQGAAAQYGKVVDALQIKEDKAAVITREWLLYLDVRRRRQRWAVKLARLTTTSTHGARFIAASCRISSTVTRIMRCQAHSRTCHLWYPQEWIVMGIDHPSNCQVVKFRVRQQGTRSFA